MGISKFSKGAYMLKNVKVATFVMHMFIKHIGNFPFVNRIDWHSLTKEKCVLVFSLVPLSGSDLIKKF